MIRTVIGVITFLSFAGVLDAGCVFVPPLESSSHVRISVVLGGKPLQGAKVIFIHMLSHECICTTDGRHGNPLDTSMALPGPFQLTDENGIANQPELAPGEYEVCATLNGVATTCVFGLHVTSNPKVTVLPMDLTAQVHRVETAPILFHVEAFRGTVTDPTGATISGTSIVVVKRRSQAKDVALTSRADADGHFSAELLEGYYIAVFFSRGFRPAIVPFEVARGGASQLSASLQVGGCP